MSRYDWFLSAYRSSGPKICDSFIQVFSLFLYHNIPLRKKDFAKSILYFRTTEIEGAGFFVVMGESLSNLLAREALTL